MDIISTLAIALKQKYYCIFTWVVLSMNKGEGGLVVLPELFSQSRIERGLHRLWN